MRINEVGDPMRKGGKAGRIGGFFQCPEANRGVMGSNFVFALKSRVFSSKAFPEHTCISRMNV